MQKTKDRFLKEEDYEGLKSMGIDLRAVFNIGKEIWALKNEMKICLAQETYDRAITLKQKIKKVSFAKSNFKLENERDSYDALYETTRYEAMIIMPKRSKQEIAFAEQLWLE